VLVVVALVSLTALASETGFLNRTVTIDKVEYRYQVYIPRDWTKKDKLPVILFLHGAGERGDDGIIQTEVGIGTAIRRFNARYPAIVVFPQCRKNVWWTEDSMQAVAIAALDSAAKEFNGDPQRTYLTGISMGGYGTWALAAKYPERFAALAPVCGGIRRPGTPQVVDTEAPDPYAQAARKIGKTPVWIFHGGADPVVPPAESRKMNEALTAVGGSVKYTEYEGVTHNSWDKAYAEPELPKWIFEQKLAPSITGKN